jgi:tripeptidyl-peptidase I
LNTQPDGSVPLVNSVSYGDDEDTIDYDWASRVDVEFQKLGVRGISVLFASGDSGVGCNKAGNRHVPTWPASSRYITAVGGIEKGFNNLVGDTISSGGFSNFWPVPQWQQAAINNYLSLNASLLPPRKFFNASSRATPDVAAFSEDVDIIINSSTVPIGGTSCACPMFAGMISLINDGLLSANKKPLGFLNPLFYQLATSNPSVFIDIVHGSNNHGKCPGFKALPGWDPVTGNGALNFKNFQTAVMSM